MNTSSLARLLFAALAIIATPLHAQDVSGEVVVRGGPVVGRVVIGDQYSSYRTARRVIVERYAPRVIRVGIRRFRQRECCGSPRLAV
jgi:hypothetical protein